MSKEGGERREREMPRFNRLWRPEEISENGTLLNDDGNYESPEPLWIRIDFVILITLLDINCELRARDTSYYVPVTRSYLRSMSCETSRSPHDSNQLEYANLQFIELSWRSKCI